jgi:hypothetical protein
MNTPEPDPSILQLIEKLKSLTAELVRGHSSNSGISKGDLKKLAVYYGVPKSLNKDILVDHIYAKIYNRDLKRSDEHGRFMKIQKFRKRKMGEILSSDEKQSLRYESDDYKDDDDKFSALIKEEELKLAKRRRMNEVIASIQSLQNDIKTYKNDLVKSPNCEVTLSQLQFATRALTTAMKEYEELEATTV